MKVNSLKYIDILHIIFMQAFALLGYPPPLRQYFKNLAGSINIVACTSEFRELYRCYYKLHEILKYVIWVTNSDKSFYQDSWKTVNCFKSRNGEKADW